MIQIPENTYVAPTEVREDVVEKLVKNFLTGRAIEVASWDDKFVHKWIRPTTFSGDGHFPFERDCDKLHNEEKFKANIRLRSCEVKKALMLLKEKKWNIWVYSSSNMTLFWVTSKPKTLRYDGARSATKSDIDAIDID